MPILASNATPLSTGPLTIDEVSWVGSVNCIGAIIGALAFGYLTTLLGSKRCVFVLAAPVVAFWLFIYFGNAYIHILIARYGGAASKIYSYKFFNVIFLFQVYRRSHWRWSAKYNSPICI